MQNVLDTDNVNGAWRYTGLPDDDGFLSTSGGQQLLGSGTPVTELLYEHRTRSTASVGIPRQTRIGFRLDF